MPEDTKPSRGRGYKRPMQGEGPEFLTWKVAPDHALSSHQAVVDTPEHRQLLEDMIKSTLQFSKGYENARFGDIDLSGRNPDDIELPAPKKRSLKK
jgi:hypothetical protein